MTDASAPPTTHAHAEPNDGNRMRARAAFAIGAALVTAWYVYSSAVEHPAKVSDFDQVWAAVRALFHHQNPYEIIGPGKAFEWKWPYYYPMPATLLVSPVGLLNVVVARCVFEAVSVGLLAWCITRDSWSRVPAFLSMSFFVSIQLVQWSPLLTAALLVPQLSWLSIVKPNWGVAIVASAATPRIWKPLMAGAALLLAASFIVQPHWVADWLARVRSATHFRTPVALPFGFLMLAVALRWRRPEARLLLAIACLPQTPGFYDALMLFVIPRSAKESWILVASSYAVFLAMAFRSPWPADSAWMSDIARFTLWFMYLPCVVMVLRRRNEGTFPVPARMLAMFTSLFRRERP